MSIFLAAIFFFVGYYFGKWDTINKQRIDNITKRIERLRERIDREC